MKVQLQVEEPLGVYQPHAKRKVLVKIQRAMRDLLETFQDHALILLLVMACTHVRVQAQVE